MTDDLQRYIFLDVDGVLNDAQSKVRSPLGYIGVDDDKINVLTEIVHLSGAQIVLSSTWKEKWYADPLMKEMQDKDACYLDNKLAEHGLTIVDKTLDNGSDRGRGIVKWLSKHEHGGWIVLDDEMFPDFKRYGITAHLVRTSFADGGLQHKHIKRALELFDVDPEPHIREDGDVSRKSFHHTGKA